MFPELIPTRAIQRAIDDFVGDLVTRYADTLEAFSKPFLYVLNGFEKILSGAPWWVVVLAVIVIAWLVSRRVVFSLSMGALLCILGVLGLWGAGMQTLSLMIMAVATSVIIGLPIGIVMARVNWLRSMLTPVLDVMQTMPSFVYLIPVLMLFGLSKFSAIIATVIYAIPPLIRLTDLGIRLVDQEVLEASRAFGANSRQQLFGVQLPLALPNIMAGINQATMMALSMVVIASMIGTSGLGKEALQGVNAMKLGRGLMAGLGIVVLAVLFDRITQSYGQRVCRGVAR